MDNVLVSPHMSGDVIGWQSQPVKVFTDNLQRCRAGEPLHDVADKTGMAVSAPASRAAWRGSPLREALPAIAPPPPR